MAFMTITSPHAHGPMTTAKIMQLVVLATLPGIFVMTWFFGFGTLVNIAVVAAVSLSLEALMMKMRGRPASFYLKDYSALVTAVLLGIALPPGSPWWLLAVGAGSSIVLAKHLYGGMGYNPFNPAMVGYVILLISFPVEMTQWVAPRGAVEGAGLGPLEALKACFGGLDLSVDAVTMATPLDVLKQNQALTMDALYQQPAFGDFAGAGWEWVNVAFLAGGLYLLYRRVYTWHAPIGMLIGLGLAAALFYRGDGSDSLGSPLFHWFSGATMLGAFFIVTDPVSSAVSNRGRLVFGISVGVLIFLIRSWGNYPDAVAFSVLLLNFAAPFIDHYTQPRTYGHAKTKRSSAQEKD